MICSNPLWGYLAVLELISNRSQTPLNVHHSRDRIYFLRVSALPKIKPAMRAWVLVHSIRAFYMPLLEPPVPVPLDESPEVPVPEESVLELPVPEVLVPELPVPLVPVPEEPEPDDPDPELDPELLLPDAPFLELPLLVPLLFELVVPLRILSSLAFESAGVVVVLLLSPGVADVLSPRLVAPAIATGTPRQNIIAIDDTALSAFVKGRRVALSKFSISKISKVVNGMNILKLTR
jgi:hypothetical protein